MRILMLNQEYPPVGGGAGFVTEELIRHLGRNNISVDLITMKYSSLPDFEQDGNFRIYRVKCIRKRPNVSNTLELFTYLVSAWVKAISLLKTNDYDFVYSHFIVPSSIISYYISKRHGIKYLVHARGSDVMSYNPDRFKFIHRLIKPLSIKILNNASVVVAGSYYFKKLINKQYGNRKIEILPNGFNGDEAIEYKKENIILFAARLFPRKGAQYLLKAINGLPKNWKCVIVGDGPYLHELEILSETIDATIEFTGWLSQNELVEYYKKSSIFVFPSSAESFGMVLVEAMHYGNAVITLAGSACEEVVDGAGIVMPNTNIELLHQKIFELIEQPALIKDYMVKSQKRAAEFRWESIIFKYVETLKKYF